jgi:sugar phosphate isomerase/epimerase
MVTRRTVLKTSLLAALGGFRLADGRSLLGASLSAASSPRKLDKIGLQLYTVRKELKWDFDGTLAEVAAIGFQEVELAGTFDHEPKEIRATLDRLGLEAPSSHVGTQHIRGDWAKSIEEARVLGNRYITCAWLSPDERKSIDAYKKIVELFNKAGEACRKSGLQFCYHNHEFEFEPLEGKIPYRVLLEETDPDLVKMQLDLFWITKADQDPLHYFKKYPGRFRMFHVKDMEDSPERADAPVGKGMIDFKRIFESAGLAGAEHFFVEEDESTGSALENARFSFDYLRKLEF